MSLLEKLPGVRRVTLYSFNDTPKGVRVKLPPRGIAPYSNIKRAADQFCKVHIDNESAGPYDILTFNPEEHRALSQYFKRVIKWAYFEKDRQDREGVCEIPILPHTTTQIQHLA